MSYVFSVVQKAWQLRYIVLEDFGDDIRGFLASAIEVAGEVLHVGVELLDVGIHCTDVLVQ